MWIVALTLQLRHLSMLNMRQIVLHLDVVLLTDDVAGIKVSLVAHWVKRVVGERTEAAATGGRGAAGAASIGR